MPLQLLQNSLLNLGNLILVGGISNGTTATIFTQTGVFGFNIPTVDPSGWELQLAESEVGCIAPDSITQVENLIFFMSAVGVHVVFPDYSVVDLTSKDIKTAYQGASNLQNSRITYDVSKQRLLCRFGDDIDKIYCFNLIPWLTDSKQQPA